MNSNSYSVLCSSIKTGIGLAHGRCAMIRYGIFALVFWTFLTGTARASLDPLPFLAVDAETAQAIEADIDRMLLEQKENLDIIYMTKKWLSKDDPTMTQERFEAAVAWIANDPYGRQVVIDVMKRARVKEVAGIMPYVTVQELQARQWMIDASDENRTIEAMGRTQYSYTVPTSLTPDLERFMAIESLRLASEPNLTMEEQEQLYQPLLLEMIEKLTKSDGLIRDLFFARTNTDLSLVYGMEVPRILVKPNVSMRTAVIAFAHEFVHFAYATFRERLTLIDYDNEEDAAFAFVDGQGEEVDAHIFEFGLNSRMYKNPYAIQKEIRDLFDSDAVFVGDRRKFAKFILEEKSYQKSFEREYFNALLTSYKFEYKALKKLEGLYLIRETEEEQYQKKGNDRKANAALASKVRIRKTIEQYEERLKKYEDKLGIVRKKKSA